RFRVSVATRQDVKDCNGREASNPSGGRDNMNELEPRVSVHRVPPLSRERLVVFVPLPHGGAAGDSDSHAFRHQYCETGRTSTAPPNRAAGMREASLTAASRPSASNTK